MIEPKISALVITYNQENVIGRCLDSLVNQREFLYEICVSDDCSSDGTWEIVQKYNREFPSLFRINRNSVNLGIFENLEKLWQMPSGNSILCCSGDDMCGKGWINKLFCFIKANRLDGLKQRYSIYSDYLIRYPSGDSLRIDQRHTKDADNLRLAIRGYHGNRACCFSRAVLDSFLPISEGKSHRVEMAQDKQVQIYTDYNYYLKGVGNIYFAGVGVSTVRSEEQMRDRLAIPKYMKSFLHERNISLKRKDLYFLDFFEARLRFSYFPSIKNFFLSLPPFFLSFDVRLFLKQFPNTIRMRVFNLRRSLPHKRQISM